MTRLSVEQWRGDALETTHGVSAVLADGDGVVEQIGEDLCTTWRSAAKPFQLEVSAGLLDPAVVACLDDGDLAVGAASHSGQPEHVRRVAALMERFGVPPDGLFCGAHAPIHDPSYRKLMRGGGEITALHNNCSGKHTFMAAACVAHGWEPDYRDPRHPLQQRIRASLEAHAGTSLGAVVDGCGVPCWVLPLSAMARAWSGLARAVRDGDGLLGRIGSAMHAQPWFVSGTGREDGALMRDAAVRVVAKVGAEGLLCGALPDRGLGFAIKVHSGHKDVRAFAAFALVERWAPGSVPLGSADPWRVVRNVVGRPVGERRLVWA